MSEVKKCVECPDWIRGKESTGSEINRSSKATGPHMFGTCDWRIRKAKSHKMGMPRPRYMTHAEDRCHFRIIRNVDWASGQLKDPLVRAAYDKARGESDKEPAT